VLNGKYEELRSAARETFMQVYKVYKSAIMKIEKDDPNNYNRMSMVKG
jgi:hypothetical protein